MLTVSYDEYTAAGGTLEEDTFNEFAPKAILYIRRLTRFQVDYISSGTDAYSAAVSAACAVLDQLHADSAGSSDIASESNDGISVSYRGTDNRNRQQRLYDCAAAYLLPFNLLYRGI